MRPVCVFADGPGSEIERLRADLRGQWRQAARAVMILLSLHGLPAAQIAALLDCHPATVRRWISRSTPTAWPGWPTGPGAGGRRWAGGGWPAGSPCCWAGILISKEIVHAVTSLGEDRSGPADLADPHAQLPTAMKPGS